MEHFDTKAASRANKREYTKEEIFCVDSKYQRSRLSKVIKKYKLLEYSCELCGNPGEWLGQSMNLCIDHKNGIPNDNRMENLRYLCYNCHSLTDTFAGRNNKTSK
jgi:5-methylcytosine-specific restriction endonuclease McrA